MFRRQVVTIPLLLLALIVILALGSCSTVQREPEVNLGMGYVLNAQVRLLAADALKAKLITKGEAQGMLTLTDTSRKTLDIARDAYLKGDKDAARRGMEIVNSILGQLKKDLEVRMAKKEVK